MDESDGGAITLLYLSAHDHNVLYVLLTLIAFVAVRVIMGIVLAVHRHVKDINVEPFYFSVKSHTVITVIQLTFLYSSELQEIRVIGNNLTFLLRAVYHFLFMIVFYHYWSVIWTSGCRSISEYVAKRYRDPIISLAFKLISLYHTFSYFGILYKETIGNFTVVGLTDLTKGIQLQGILMLTSVHCFALPAVIFGGITLVNITTLIDFIVSFIGMLGVMIVLFTHNFKTMVKKSIFQSEMWYHLNHNYMQCGQQYMINVLFYGLCCPLGFDTFAKAAIQKNSKKCVIVSQTIRILWVLYLLFCGIVYYSHYHVHHPDVHFQTSKQTIDWLTDKVNCSIANSTFFRKLYSTSVSLALATSLSREYGMHMLSTAKQFRTDILTKVSLGLSVHPDFGVYGYWSTLFCAGSITTIMTILFSLTAGIDMAILDRISRAFLPLNLSVMLMAPIFSDVTALGVYIGSAFSLLYSFYMARFFDRNSFHKSISYAVFNKHGNLNSSLFENVRGIGTKDEMVANYLFDLTPISAVFIHVITSIVFSKMHAVGFRNKEEKYYFKTFSPKATFKHLTISTYS